MSSGGSGDRSVENIEIIRGRGTRSACANRRVSAGSAAVRTRFKKRGAPTSLNQFTITAAAVVWAVVT